MKKIILAFTLLATASLTSCWQRIGDLTMVSNRNVDSGQKYELIQRDVEAKAKMKNDDALEVAIDNLTNQYNGEYLMNVQIYVTANGQKVKVRGDVWGVKPDTLR